MEEKLCHRAVCGYTVVVLVITFVYFNCSGFLYHHLGIPVMCSKCFPFLYTDCFKLKVGYLTILSLIIG